MIVDENNPTPCNTPVKPGGSSPLRPDVQAAVQKFLHTRSACPPKLVTNNFAAIWALEKEHQRRAMLKKAKWESEMSATSVAPPEQQEDQAWFMTNVAHTFLQFMAKTIGPQPNQPHIAEDEHQHARDPVEVIYSTPQPTIPAPRNPPQTQAQADSAACGPREDPTTYAAQYLAGIVPPASLAPTGNPVNPDAIYESSSSSSSSLDFWMTSGMGYAIPPSSSAGSSGHDESLFSLGSRFSLGQQSALGDDAVVSVAPLCSAQALSKSTKLRAEAPVFVPRAC